MTGELLPVAHPSVTRCEAAARELAAALRDADAAGLGLIDIVPPVLAVFREEGMAFDASAIPGLGGMLG